MRAKHSISSLGWIPMNKPNCSSEALPRLTDRAKGRLIIPPGYEWAKPAVGQDAQYRTDLAYRLRARALAPGSGSNTAQKHRILTECGEKALYSVSMACYLGPQS